MRLTSSTVILGFITAACAVPIGVDSSAEDLTARDFSVDSLSARAETYKATDAYFIPVEESAAEKHHSPRAGGGFKAFKGTSQSISITYSAPDKVVQDPNEAPLPPPSAEKSLQKVKELLKAAESVLGIKDPLVSLANHWTGSPNYVKFTFSGPKVCKGACRGAAYGSDIGSIHASDGKELYNKDRKA